MDVVMIRVGFIDLMFCLLWEFFVDVVLWVVKNLLVRFVVLVFFGVLLIGLDNGLMIFGFDYEVFVEV